MKSIKQCALCEQPMTDEYGPLDKPVCQSCWFAAGCDFDVIRQFDTREDAEAFAENRLDMLRALEEE